MLPERQERPAANRAPSNVNDSRIRVPRERYIEVTLDPRGVWAEVGPYKARGLLISVGAKQPVWLPNRGAWSVSYKRGVDAIALAERFRYVVVVKAAEITMELSGIPDSSESQARDLPLEVHQGALRADGDRHHRGDHHDDQGVGLW